MEPQLPRQHGREDAKTWIMSFYNVRVTIVFLWIETHSREGRQRSRVRRSAQCMRHTLAYNAKWMGFLPLHDQLPLKRDRKPRWRCTCHHSNNKVLVLNDLDDSAQLQTSEIRTTESAMARSQQQMRQVLVYIQESPMNTILKLVAPYLFFPSCAIISNTCFRHHNLCKKC